MPKPTAAAIAAPLPATTRRAVLKAAGALGTVAALVVPVAILPKAKAASVDPVFAAIQAFRDKRAAWNAALNWQAREEAACEARGVSYVTNPSPEMVACLAHVSTVEEADAGAWWAFLNTAPTTREGAMAFLAMLTDRDGYGGGITPDADELEAICASLGAFIAGGANG
jgi:hypothetical protein